MFLILFLKSMKLYIFIECFEKIPTRKLHSELINLFALAFAVSKYHSGWYPAAGPKVSGVPRGIPYWLWENTMFVGGEVGKGSIPNTSTAVSYWKESKKHSMPWTWISRKKIPDHSRWSWKDHYCDYPRHEESHRSWCFGHSTTSEGKRESTHFTFSTTTWIKTTTFSHCSGLRSSQLVRLFAGVAELNLLNLNLLYRVSQHLFQI